MDNLEPQDPPAEGTDGQQAATQDAAHSPQDDAAERFAKLEEQNRNLQLRLTQYGRELKQYKEAPPVQQGTPEDSWDWSNPTGSVQKAFKSVLSEYKEQERQERQAQDVLKRVARQRGIDESELEDYYARLRDLPPDPQILADTIARMYQAEHVDTAITAAARNAQQSAQRNARAVTTETSGTRSTDPIKPIADMTDAELEAHVKATFGVAERSA